MTAFKEFIRSPEQWLPPALWLALGFAIGGIFNSWLYLIMALSAVTGFIVRGLVDKS